MSFLNDFPYVRQYDGDLGWLIRNYQRLAERLEYFVNYNAIKYADPIGWNITTQYEANTVVIDPASGTAYISTRPVPSGILVTNTDYWTPIFNYAENMDHLREQLAADNQHANVTFSHAVTAGQLIWSNGDLYRVNSDLAAGTAILPGVNVTKVTFEELFNDYKDEVTEILQTALADINGRVETIEEEFRQQRTIWVTPEMYGAVGDGTTDDTAAIQAALDSGAMVAMIPGHSYRTGALRITRTGSLIDCRGCEITAADTVTIFSVEGCNFVTIRNLNVLNARRAVAVYDCRYFILDGFRMTTKYFAVNLEMVWFFSIRNGEFIQDESAHSNADGIHFFAGCHFGDVDNLRGYTNDDFLALNSREQEHPESVGGINNIVFRNISTASGTRAAYSAVRIYNTASTKAISNIRFENCNLNSSEQPAIRITNSANANGDPELGLCVARNISFIGCTINRTETADSVIRINYATLGAIVFDGCTISGAVASQYAINMYHATVTDLKLLRTGITGSFSDRVLRIADSSAITNLFLEECQCVTGSIPFIGAINGSTISRAYVVRCWVRGAFGILAAYNAAIDHAVISQTEGKECTFAAVAQSNGAFSEIGISDCIMDVQKLVRYAGTPAGLVIRVSAVRCTLVEMMQLDDRANVRMIGDVYTAQLPGAPVRGDMIRQCNDSTFTGIAVYNGTAWKLVTLA